MINNEILEKFNEMEQKTIIPYLRGKFPAIASACCLYHMIEQGEDIYTYLIDGKYVIKFEVSRIDNSIIEDSVISVHEYAKMKKGKQFHSYQQELLDLSQRDDFQI